MKIMLFLFAAFMLWSGGQALYTCVTNFSPGVYTFDEYLEQRPDNDWLNLTGCSIDLTDASYFTKGDKETTSEIYVPIHSATGGKTEKDIAMVAIKDKETIQFLNKLITTTDEDEVMKLFEENEGLMIQENIEIDGLVEFGVTLKDDEVKELKGLNENLADDFVIIARGAKPSWLRAARILLGLLVIVFLFRPSGSSEQA